MLASADSHSRNRQPAWRSYSKALQGLHDMWKWACADLHAAREGVAGLDDGHAVRLLGEAFQRQLLRPGLLQVAHHPQVVPACRAVHILSILI